MTAKDILNGVKELLLKFNTQPEPTPATTPAEPVKMANEVKLKDGTVISVDKLEVGGLVTVEGNPAPDGEYILEDGTILQTQGGAIVEISSPAEDMMPEEMKALPAKFQTMAAQFAEVEQGYKAKFEAQENNIKVLKESVEKMHEALILMSEQSVVAPKEKDPSTMTPLEKFRLSKQK